MSLRLTGGVFKGREIQTPPHADTTRPTQAKIRQAIFNSLQAVTPQARVLDLFAGSGALGFEALSREASRVVFVERDRLARKILDENSTRLNVRDRVEIAALPVEDWIERRSGADLALFDLVFADPPYDSGWHLRMISEWDWSRILAPDGLLVVEWGRGPARRGKSQETIGMPERTGFLVKVREKNYGDTNVTTFQLQS